MLRILLSLIALLLMIVLLSCREEEQTPQYTDFSEYPLYAGRDLGVTYTTERSVFKLWSPIAQSARLRLYESGVGGEAWEEVRMQAGEQGVWVADVKGDLADAFYTFQVKINGIWQEEAVDPYARAVGVNGLRGQVIDLRLTNPPGWKEDQRPPLAAPTDIVIYELHVRDLSSHPSSGIQHAGKFLGVAETGTKSPQGLATGLDHMAELGITHVHLLPVFDFLSVDESKLDSAQFNWGYDPQNYNVPEGSYSTDPYNGAVRIREFKQMVKALHEKGIRVIMDVVYNHTGRTENSNFNRLVPGYYYRQAADGSFSDASACGNEVASERPMMRKFIRESVEYWVDEFHVDGFRFDLMGIHDIQTMNDISAALHAIDSTIFIYGEGWTAGPSPLPDSVRALKANTSQLNRIAAFSDDVRDGLKGSVFEHEERGFATGLPGREESIRFGIVAATEHPQVLYDSVNYSKAPWAAQPSQCITYVSCHDNHTLWDRLRISVPDASEAERIKMDKLATAVVLTSQGVAFLHAGEEMLRTKYGEENSYNLPDRVNQLDWTRKSRYRDVYDYYRGLIALRRNHPAFRLRTTQEVQRHLRFLDTGELDNIVAYQLTDNAGGDAWQNILVVFNGARRNQRLPIPQGDWTVVVNGNAVNEEGLGAVRGGSLSVPASTAMVLVQGVRSEE